MGQSAGRVASRMMFGGLALMVACYIGYQVWRVVTTEYETVPAVEYRISDKIMAKGVAIREERVLPDQGDENLSYLYADGTHVAKGMAVAQSVSGKEEITNRMKRDALEEELEAIQGLAGPGEVMILQTDSLIQRVYADIDTISAGMATGDLSVVLDLKVDILNQLNRRSVAMEEGVDFPARAAELEKRIAALGIAEEAPEGQTVAPEPGYFTKRVDGLEDVLTLQQIEDFSVDDFVEHINAPVASGDQGTGKIITSHIWYFAAYIPAGDAGKFSEGRKAELDLGLAKQRPFIAKINKVLLESGDARAIVVFQCDNMSEELSNIRTHKVDISLSEMSGYKLPQGCTRFRGSQLGVYVLKTTVIEFKPVEIIFQNEKEGYLVFSMNFRADNGDGKEDGLRRFDQVIIGGNGLKNGKVL